MTEPLRTPARREWTRRGLSAGDTWLFPALPEHADALFALVQRDRARLARWLSWVRDVREGDDMRAFLRASAAEWDQGAAYRFVFWLPEPDGGRFEGPAGVIGLEGVSARHASAQLGYWIGSPWEGRGHVVRAAERAVRFGFEEVGLARIEVAAAVENARSRAVIERLGAGFEGVRRSCEQVGERRLDHAVYALLRDDPPPARAAR